MIERLNGENSLKSEFSIQRKKEREAGREKGKKLCKVLSNTMRDLCVPLYFPFLSMSQAQLCKGGKVNFSV